jgi:hypothetical protein
VLFICGFQVFFIQATLEDSLNPPTGQVTENYFFWSWIGGLMVGVLVYRYYEFTKDSSPRLAFWAYSLGFNLSLKLVDNPIDCKPDQSGRYI